MKLLITGCNGKVGKCVVSLAMKRGYTVVGVDYSGEPSSDASNNPKFTHVQADLREFEEVLKVVTGSEAVVHLAAHPTPGDYKVNTHNNNVVISWNVLQACAELGIYRVAQASSVNVMPLIYSQGPQFNYFPIDESHPCCPDEPYGLSKVICEIQADTIVRRYPFMRVASLRLHAFVPSRSFAKEAYSAASDRAKDALWAYVLEDSTADAFLRAVEENGKWSGHEAFFIAAPHSAVDDESLALKQKFWPNVPIKEGKDLSGTKSFFDCTKAEKLLDWTHRD